MTQAKLDHEFNEDEHEAISDIRCMLAGTTAIALAVPRLRAMVSQASIMQTAELCAMSCITPHEIEYVVRTFAAAVQSFAEQNRAESAGVS